MDAASEKSFKRKLYIVSALIIAILCLLFYLIFSGSTKRIRRVSGLDGDPAVTPSAQPTLKPTPSPETTPTPSPTPESTPTPAPTPDPKELDDIASDDSVTRIVNLSNTIDPGYVPGNLVQPKVANIGYSDQNYLRADAAEALEKMFAAAKKDGAELYLISGYRSYETQVALWNYWVDLKGEEYASQLDAHPGACEHQTGLAVDLGMANHKCELSACFADTKGFSWLQDNAYKYGFIERYPDGKENVTGISFAPWNFRYVGTDAAERIYTSGLTMEEYYGCVPEH